MYAVTGATGHLGRLVIAALLNRMPPAQIVALVRDPARAADLAALGIELRRFDYDVPGELAGALAGVERLLLISSDDVARRVGQHRAVIDAAAKAGVGFLAYTSVLHADRNPLGVAPSHRETEAMLRDGGVPHAILRNGWYTENYLIGAEAAVAHGVLLGSTGEGRISGAARADYADAAAAVLAAGPEAAGTYELAGDSGFTLSDVAAALAGASGRPVIYRNLSEADYAQALIAHGVLLGSTGEGRISGAARADYADAAAAVLAAGPQAAGTYELAGDSGFTLSDVAAALAEASGRPVIYRNLSEADYAQALTEAGVPPDFAKVLAGFSAGAANNILADDSRTLSRLIGRPTTGLQAVVAGAVGSARS